MKKKAVKQTTMFYIIGGIILLLSVLLAVFSLKVENVIMMQFQPMTNRWNSRSLAIV